ncbi:MAG: alpha/beta hydrolase [Hyphomonadaceae bacterium]
MASEDFRKLLERMRARGRGGDVTLGEQRALMEQLAALFPPPETVVFESAAAGSVPVEWAIPPAPEAGVLLYFHGGGYGMGSVATHRGLVGRLAAGARMRALSVEYRLAPEHPYPAALEDALAAYSWLRTRHAPQSIFLAGDSAGGGLVLALLLALRSSNEPMPAGAVCMSPWTDMACTGASMETRAEADPAVMAASLADFARAYLNGAMPTTPLASPLYGDLTGLPPLLILVGDAEILLDDSTRLAERARAAGVDVTLEIWPEMIHIWPYFAPRLQEGREAIARMAAFVRA